MNDLEFEQRRRSRRRLLASMIAAGCGLLAPVTGFSQIANTEQTKGAEMIPTELIHALRSLGTPVCLDAANRLAAFAGAKTGFDLHLRHVGLDKANAQVLAGGLLHLGTATGPFLRSFSASYNPDLGDIGTAALIAALPQTVTELGMVGCSIGDAGAGPILNWAQTAPNLRMICIENNEISAEMKSQFHNLKSAGRQIYVVV